MSDPVLEAARRAVAQGEDTLRRVVRGLPTEALNWKPAGPDTNSITVLATHGMHATRVLLCMAAGLPAPARGRAAEFGATADEPLSLLALIDRLAGECDTILGTCKGIDWSTPRQRRRDDGSILEMSAAEALLFAVTHLRGHADEAALTRHFWPARF
ncbi:MAG: DinB family protein [Actinomycetota bacterium]